MSGAVESSTDPYLLVEKCGSARGVPIYVITKHTPSVRYCRRYCVSDIYRSATGGYPPRTVCATRILERWRLMVPTEGNQMHGPRSRGHGNIQGSARRLHIYTGSGSPCCPCKLLISLPCIVQERTERFPVSSQSLRRGLFWCYAAALDVAWISPSFIWDKVLWSRSEDSLTRLLPVTYVHLHYTLPTLMSCIVSIYDDWFPM